MAEGPVRRKVTVGRGALRFAAAHFTTFAGRCESLHGHNYDVLVEVEGELTEDAWVFDFVELREVTRALLLELDHRFLLPLHNPLLELREEDEAWVIAFRGRRYVLPKGDVCPLPIDNATAERLAEWLAERLREALRGRGATNITAITVGVEEAPGQAGWCTIPF